MIWNNSNKEVQWKIFEQMFSFGQPPVFFKLSNMDLLRIFLQDSFFQVPREMPAGDGELLFVTSLLRALQQSLIEV